VVVGVVQVVEEVVVGVAALVLVAVTSLLHE